MFRISNPHDTHHKGYFLLILWLPPNGENNSNGENKEQHKKGDAPAFQPRDRLHSVSGQNTQAQHKKRCKVISVQSRVSMKLHLDSPFLESILIQQVLYLSTLAKTESSFGLVLLSLWEEAVSFTRSIAHFINVSELLSTLGATILLSRPMHLWSSFATLRLYHRYWWDVLGVHIFIFKMRDSK